MFVLDHVGLRQVEADAQDVGTVGAGYSGESQNQFAAQLLGFGAIAKANIRELQSLFESEASAFVEGGEKFCALDRQLKIVCCGFGIVVDESDHSAGGGQPDLEIGPGTRKLGDQCFLLGENGFR